MQFAYALLLPLSIYAGATTLADLQLSGKVLVLAAASTTDAVDQTQQVFQAANPGVTLRVSYGSSSALAKQIAAGAKADIFLAASSDWADYLDKKQLIAERYELLENRLVIVVPDASKLSIEKIDDLTQAGVGHLALADPASVPAGIYAKQALSKLKLWEALKGKIVSAADVRQALKFVETGAADAGIVYYTDAVASQRVRTVAKIDPGLSDAIRYPLVLTVDGGKNPAAVAYFRFLAGPQAAESFRKQGFIVAPSRDDSNP